MYYKRIDIKSEADLPKEDCWLYVAKKDDLKTAGLKPRIFTTIKATKKQWIDKVAWYLLPDPSVELTLTALKTSNEELQKTCEDFRLMIQLLEGLCEKQKELIIILNELADYGESEENMDKAFELRQKITELENKLK